MTTRYWVGGSGVWSFSNTSNWSTTSGGSGGASVPTSSTDVIFDQNSDAGSLFVVSIIANVSARTITFDSLQYDVTFSFSSNNILLFGTNTTVWYCDDTDFIKFSATGSGGIFLAASPVSGTRSIIHSNNVGFLDYPNSYLNCRIGTSSDNIKFGNDDASLVCGLKNLTFDEFTGTVTACWLTITGSFVLSSGMTIDPIGSGTYIDWAAVDGGTVYATTNNVIIATDYLFIESTNAPSSPTFTLNDGIHGTGILSIYSGDYPAIFDPKDNNVNFSQFQIDTGIFIITSGCTVNVNNFNVPDGNSLQIPNDPIEILFNNGTSGSLFLSSNETPKETAEKINVVSNNTEINIYANFNVNNLEFIGSSGDLTINTTYSNDLKIYGNFKLASGSTISSSSADVVFYADTGKTNLITTNAIDMVDINSWTFSGPSVSAGTIKLEDNWTSSTLPFIQENINLDLNGNQIDVTTFESDGATITFNGGTITCNDGGASAFVFANGTTYAGTANGFIRLKGIDSTFDSDGASYFCTLSFENVSLSTSTILGSNYFYDILLSGNTTDVIKFPSGETTTIENLSPQYGYIESTTAGVQATLSQSSGKVLWLGAVIKDSNAIGGATWVAKNGLTVDDGNNSGWIFDINRYWVGGSGTWNTTNTANWSDTSGGTSGASVPASYSFVNFDDNSAVSPFTVTLGNNITVAYIYAYLNSAASAQEMTLNMGNYSITTQGFDVQMDVDTDLFLLSTNSGEINVSRDFNSVDVGNTFAWLDYGIEVISANSLNVNVTGNQGEIQSIAGNYVAGNSIKQQKINLNVISSGVLELNSINFHNVYISDDIDYVVMINDNVSYITGNARFPFKTITDYGFSGNLVFFGTNSGTYSIELNGAEFPSTVTVYFGGSYADIELQDNFSALGDVFIGDASDNFSFNLNGNTLSAPSVTAGTSGDAIIIWNGGEINVSGAGFISGTGTQFQQGSGNGTINMSGSGAQSLQIEYFPVYSSINIGGLGPVSIYPGDASGNWADITSTVVNSTVIFTGGEDYNFDEFNLANNGYGLITIKSDVDGVQHYLKKSSGTVNQNFIYIIDSNAGGGATWNAGINSPDGGNNSGWNFAAPLPFLNSGFSVF